MSQILLLTKNTLNEQSFEKRLRHLGHEVYTSTMMIDACLFETPNSEMVKIFQHVILSETIANVEVKELVKRIEGKTFTILRKSDERLDDKQLEEWKKLGVSDWIESEPEIEALREKISNEQSTVNQKVFLLPQASEKRSLSSLSLSKGEAKLFHILYEQPNKTVSREEICLRLWNKPKTNSSMSQLSVMVKHLKVKLANQNIYGPLIETCWGEGYRLHEAVFEQIYIEKEQKEYV